MERTLSFLSDDLLSAALSAVLRVARRLGCGFDRNEMWHGPNPPRIVWMLLDEYKVRRQTNGRDAP